MRGLLYLKFIMEIKIYLAGGMNESNWQKTVIESVKLDNIVFFNPREHGLIESREYTLWDILYLKKSDIVFAYMEKDNPSGLGLSLEIGYARALDKTIILIDEKSIADNKFAQRFKIVRECTTVTYNSLEDGINFLNNLHNGVNMRSLLSGK